MNQTAYVKITSGNVHLHQPQVEPWHQRNERDYLARSRPGPSASERALEQALWDQVSGKASPPPPPQNSAQRLSALEQLLFNQIASIGPGRPQNGSVSDFPGKPGL